MRHTKGPWELRENIPYDTGGWVVFRGRFAENRTICRLPYGNMLPCPDTPERQENTANAHLIAAAPELLEALEEMLESAVPNPKEHPTMWAAWGKARAVVAKAKGGVSTR